MPLAKGVTMETVARNAQEMKSSGHPPNQSWAAAFEQRRRTKSQQRKKKRGRPPKSLVVKGLV